ncbi:MAG: xanthine dehydrogenase family protein subunit M, partial [Acidimicrobiia bacterium]|nr:xanthine dehydrogenase family protein subunit M [Acidimicrobiia bacterium]
MTIAQVFDYQRPESLEQAVQMLAEHGGDVRVLAGGTDLVAWLRDEAVAPDLLVDIKQIEGLGEISDEGDAVSIGSLVTFTDVINSGLVAARLPLVSEMSATVASVGIRNRATLVGNICSAVPSCDAGPPLLVHGAIVHTFGRAGARQIPIDDWFLGPRETALAPGEIVTKVVIPVPPGGHGAAFVRLSRYEGEDLAQASVAIVAPADHRFRVAFGAVAATPMRARRIESLLEGKALDPTLVAEAIALVSEEISPISDIRASKEFRLRMSEVMLQRGLKAAVERLEGNGPSYGTNL